MADDIDLSDDDDATLDAVSDRVGALRGGATRKEKKPNKFIGDADEAKAIVAAMQRGVDGDTPPDACPTE